MFRSSSIGSRISLHKQLTIDFISSLDIVTPEAVLYQNPGQAEAFLQKYGKIVVKPADAGQSKGVAVNISDSQTLEAAVEYARTYSGKDVVQLQKQLDGKLYRLFVLNGKLVAAAHRRAPQVVGDGVKTVAELIAELNTDLRRGDGSTTPLKKIDAAVSQEFLGAETYANVPEIGEIVKVSPIDSVSAGGEAENVTD